MQIILKLALFLALLLLAAFSNSKLSSYSLKEIKHKNQENEVLYLPSGLGLQFISFGYQSFLSDILWFNTISYFGKHYRSDRDYRWMNHMCKLVSTLDPQAEHVYKFCSSMLAWEAGLPKEAIAILSNAIKQYPKKWEYFYLRGFAYFFFLKDEETARKDLTYAAKLPQAPVFVKRLAAKKTTLSDPQTAISFLKDLIKNAEDETEKEALKEKLLEAIYEADLRTLERALAIHKAQHGQQAQKLTDLVSSGIIKSNLKDPFGGIYYLDKEDNSIKSTSGKKRIRLFLDNKKKE